MVATGVAGAATQPLPTSLLGTTVKVKDSAGTERPASLFFVSSLQVNYVIPSGTAIGTAMVTVQSGSGTISQGTVQVARFAPALFTADASGRGLPAAFILRLKPDLSQLNEDVYQRDPVTGAVIARSVHGDCELP